MADGKEYGDSRSSVVLEGMYKGVAGKIDEMRQSVAKELQFSSTQQISAYESLTDYVKQGLEAVLAEMRYLSQQNSAIYEYGESARLAMQEALLGAVRAAAEETEQKIAERFAQADASYRNLEKEIEDLRAELIAVSAAPAAMQEAVYEHPVEGTAEDLAENAEEGEAQAAAPAETEESEEGFDYDLLAEKISTILPETDYDAVAERVVAALPAGDADAIADKVLAGIPAPDETAIADKVAEAIPPVDYDLIAERVSGALEHEFDVVLDEEGIEKLARRVAELLKEQGLAAAAPAPAEEQQAPAPVAPEEEIATAAPLPVVAAAETSDDADMTTRYKRSFEAKVIESEDDVKQYYSDLKNVLLSYGKVRSQISWSNDRYTVARETLAKIGIRGKTLCLYLALNPDEFPTSVYHQKYAGDTKMYEKTPMMLKIKSNVAVKRATRLIELLMEKNGAVKTDAEPVDYTKDYAWKSERELLEAGLIKTALVEKSDLDF